MSQVVIDADGFQLVQRRARGHYRAPRLHFPPPPHKVHFCEGAELGKRVRAALDTLQHSQFHKEFVEQLHCDTHAHPREVICYGIGHVGSCPVASMQFALLMVIMEQCKPDSTLVYDPVLCEEEQSVLTDFNCTLIPSNELCKRPAEVATLFYMPHCGKAMYNNLLWANWSTEQLAKMSIIGNSFSSYIERIPTKQLQQEAPYIRQISQYCCEHSLPRCFPDPAVFNDLSLHTFPPYLLQSVPTSVWANHNEPIIDLNDPEIITS